MSESTSSQKKDVVAQQLGRLYAGALYGAAEANNDLEEALGDLDGFIYDVLDPNPKLEELLASPRLDVEEKQGILDRVLGKSANTTLLNFLKVLAHHERLEIVREVREQIIVLKREAAGNVELFVTTATDLGDEHAQKITSMIKERLAVEPELVQTVDPDVIGGIVLRLGDKVFDGSVASQLKRLRKQIVQRSIHEIQNRRDRFCNPEGN
jgi:F-type H+-transporting ATPase subunit delta